jgi:hypothetical protein
MTLKNIFINKKINDIQINMLREKEKCYIKIIPLTQKSSPKKLFITINGEKYNWEIYDKNGKDSHRIYLKGQQIEPCFYMIDSKNLYKIFCKKNDIDIKKLSKENKNKIFEKDINNCISSDITCWGVNIYMTSRKEKSPFCFM